MSGGEQSCVKFAFFGDSICAGQGVSIHRTWAVRLSALLEDALGQSGRGLVTMNPSINGDTTWMALGRIAHDIQNHRVDAIMIQFGMNDANHWDTDLGAPRVSEAAFAALAPSAIVQRAVTASRISFSGGTAAGEISDAS